MNEDDTEKVGMKQEEVSLSPEEIAERQARQEEENFKQKYGVSSQEFGELLRKRLDHFSKEASAPDGEQFKRNTERGLLGFLEKKHEFEVAAKKQEELEQEQLILRKKQNDELTNLHKTRKGLGLHPDGTSVELGVLAEKQEENKNEIVANTKQFELARENIIGPNNLTNWSTEELVEFRNSGLFSAEENEELDFELNLRAQHINALKEDEAAKVAAKAEEERVVNLGVKNGTEFEPTSVENIDLIEPKKDPEQENPSIEAFSKKAETLREKPPFFEIADFFEKKGFPLSDELVSMLSNEEEHQTHRRGDGFTQVSRVLANMITWKESVFGLAKDKYNLIAKLEDEANSKGEDIDKINFAQRIGITGEDIRTFANSSESEGTKVIAKLIAGIFDRSQKGGVLNEEIGKSFYSFVPERKIGTCTTSEMYFLNYFAGDRDTRKNMHVFVNELGKPVMLHKGRNLGEPNMALLLEPIVINNIEIPPGSLVHVDIEHGSEELRHINEKNNNVNIYNMADIKGLNFIRLSTLSVSPDQREKVFGKHFQEQKENILYKNPSTLTLEDAREFCKKEIETILVKKNEITLKPEGVLPVSVHFIKSEFGTGKHIPDSEKIIITPKKERKSREGYFNQEKGEENLAKKEFVRRIENTFDDEIIPQVKRFSDLMEERANNRFADLLEESDITDMLNIFNKIGESFSGLSAEKSETYEELVDDITSAIRFFTQVDALRPRTAREDVEDLMQLDRSLILLSQDIDSISEKILIEANAQENEYSEYLFDLGKKIRELASSIEDSSLLHEINRRIRALS